MSRKRSRGIQAILAGATSAIGALVAAVPHIVPLLDPGPARVVGAIAGALGAAVAAMSVPPRVGDRARRATDPEDPR